MIKSEMDLLLNEVIARLEGLGVRAGVDVKVTKEIRNCHCGTCCTDDHPSEYRTKIIISALFQKPPEQD